MSADVAQPAAWMSAIAGSENGSIGNITANRRRRSPRRYSCAYCPKAFKRSEHCIRHQRTHTNEKPFSCRYCRRSYSRKDLVTRHERTLHAEDHAEQMRIALEGDGLSVVIASEESDGERQQMPNTSQIAACVPRGASEDSPLSPLSSCPLLPDSPLPERDTNVSTEQVAEAPATAPTPSASASASSPPPSAPRPATACDSIIVDRPLMEEARLAGHPGVEEQENTRLASPPVLSPTMVPAPPWTLSPTMMPTSDPLQQSHLLPLFTRLPDGFDLYNMDGYMPMQIDLNHHQQRLEANASEVDNNRQIALSRDFHQHHHHQSQNHSVAQTNPTDQGFPVSLQASRDGVADFSFSPLPDGPFSLTHDESILHMPGFMDLPDPSTFGLDISAQVGYQSSSHGITQSHKSNRSNGSETGIAREAQRNLGVLLDDRQSAAPPFITIDREAHDYLCKDLAERLNTQDVVQGLPSATICQAFLSSYLGRFHGHLPIIHLGTLRINTSPSPLILAMCAIGALYRLDRRRSRHLYDVTWLVIVNTTAPVSPYTKTSPEDWPLWVVQTKLLLTFYAALSGDKDLTSCALHENGFYTLVYGKTRLALAADTVEPANMSWTSWVKRESWKRLLGGIYVASTLTMVIFGVNPSFNTSQDLDLEIFHHEKLWDAKTANEWRELQTSIEQPSRTMKEVLAEILSENNNRNDAGSGSYRISAFVALLLMHAVVVHMQQLLQVTQTLSPGSPSSLPGLHGSTGSWLMNMATRSLARCQELLGASDDDLNSDEGRSLVFSCQAILRMAYIRIFDAAIPFNRLSLISTDPGAIKPSVSAFVESRLTRSPDLLDAVSKCFDGFRIPVRMGHLLVRKTAAFSWSVEHAVAGWDCALFVTKWVHSVEMDCLRDVELSSAETELLASMKEVLEEADYEPGETKSLAAGMARAWGWFLQDVWVWGLTPRMGAILEQMASAYERVSEAS